MAEESLVAGAVQIGEHLEDIGHHVATIITKCLQKHVSPGVFAEAWNAAIEWNDDDEDEDDEDEDDEDDDISEHTCHIPHMTQVDGEILYWSDHIENADAVPRFYAHAVETQCDRVIVADDNAFVSLVALRGDPDIRAILQCLEDSSDVSVLMTDVDAAYWPHTHGHGGMISLWFGAAPLAEITFGDGLVVRVE